MKKRCSHEHGCDLGSMTERLRAHDKRITGPRQAILEIFRAFPGPLTNREILGHMRPRQCDLATIYRSVGLLEKMGLVQRCDFGDGVARYELVGQGHHHHHLICRQCAEIVEVPECLAADLERQIAERSGFKALTHKLEFFGLCPRCQG